MTQAVNNLSGDGKIHVPASGSRYNGNGIYPNINVSVMFDPTWAGLGNNTLNGRQKTPNVKAGQPVRCRLPQSCTTLSYTWDLEIQADDPGAWDDPIGTIKIFTSTSASVIPQGWNLCDGSNGTVNLSGRFVMGVNSGGSAYFESVVGNTGGSRSIGPQVTESGAPVQFSSSSYKTDNRPPYYVLAYIQRVS
jgi:hypothetical protein